MHTLQRWLIPGFLLTGIWLIAYTVSTPGNQLFAGFLGGLFTSMAVQFTIDLIEDH